MGLKIVKQKNTYFRQQTSTDQDKIHKKLEELYGKLANKLKHDVDYTDCTDWTEKKARLAGYKRLFAIARQAADDEYIEEFTDNKNYATELERVDQEEIDRIKKETLSNWVKPCGKLDASLPSSARARPALVSWPPTIYRGHNNHRGCTFSMRVSASPFLGSSYSFGVVPVLKLVSDTPVRRE